MPISSLSRHLSCTAMLFNGVMEPFTRVEMPLPLGLGEGEVLVSLHLAAICGSDLHTYEGRRKEPVPSVLGHEGVGTVVAIGQGRKDVRIGARVTWSLVDSCGCCPYCTQYALPQKCENMYKYGHSLWTPSSAPDGCYSTHIVLRKGTKIVELPDNVDDGMAVSANCALSTMVNAVSHVKPGTRSVLIQGGGLLGLFCTALLREKEVQQVYITDIDPRRLQLASLAGATAVPAEEAGQYFRTPRLVDAVIEVAGSASLFPQGMNALRFGGSYLLVGLVHPDTRIDITGEQIVRRCINVQGVYNYAPWHLEEAVAFLARSGNSFPWGDTFSKPYALGELNEAFSEARRRTWPRVTIDCTAV